MAKEKSAKTSTVKKETTSTRKPSSYNLFMKSELPKVKAENPNLDHKEAFKLVASRWKDSPENPKNPKNNATTK
ncbi:hypothetical protein G9A89_019818 [Geosiphon pyriformis]|nr:hypothetical protein G9A89_019818 [Geosiphon pyriformis]